MLENGLTETRVGAAKAATVAPPCDDCLGEGGWVRYEPACEPARGLRYLSCLQCRGSGRGLAAGK